MARTINKEEHADKRNEIIKVFRQLIYTKGYEQMTIQDILDELKISKGAFYHYFDSKPALLEALVEQMMDEAEQIIAPIVNDPYMTALEKFQQFFSAISSWKTAQKAFVVALLRVWFADDNAIVRHKVNLMMSQRVAPHFSVIVQQGIQERVFKTDYPTLAGAVVLSILIGMQNTISQILFAAEKSADSSQQSREIVATYDVYLDSMERTLGAPSGSLFRLDHETAQLWIDALKASSSG